MTTDPTDPHYDRPRPGEQNSWDVPAMDELRPSGQEHDPATTKHYRNLRESEVPHERALEIAAELGHSVSVFARRRHAIAAAKRRAVQAENRRAAVAAYGDTSTDSYRQLCADADAAYGSWMELVHDTQ